MSIMQNYTSLLAIYNSPNRYYHNLNHINYCIAKLDECIKSVSLTGDSINIISSAIWYHDIYYNIWEEPGLNEKASADFYTDTHGKDALPAVMEAILATAHHLKDQEHLSRTTQYMLDIDLSAFGDRYEVVEYNSDNVLKEYEPMALSQTTLLANRINFLKKLLERKRIYYTGYFFDTYEQKARDNIQRLIEVSEQKMFDTTQGLADTSASANYERNRDY